MDLPGSAVGNIGPKEQARLRVTGAVALVCGLVLGVAVILYHVPWWVRLTLFFTLWLGVSALLQAKAQTSVRLAARRMRRIDGREEPEFYVVTFRERARTIQRRSLFFAALLVTLFTLLG